MKGKKGKNKTTIIPYRRDNKWGYCDNKLNIKIPIIYDEALPFSGGLAAVRLGERWGFVNKNGNQAIKFQFKTVSDFSENGQAIAYMKDSKDCLIINNKGKVIRSYDPKLVISEDAFNELISYNDFLTYYLYVNQDREKEISKIPCGYLNSDGNFIEDKYIAEIELKKNENFTERFVPVKIGWKWNFINNSDQLLFKAKMKLSDFFEHTLFDYSPKKNLDSIDDIFKDSLSEPRIPYEPDGFDEVHNFSEGLAAVKIDNKWGFINKKGKVIIKCQYDDIPDNDFYLFKGGISKVRDLSLRVTSENKDGFESEINSLIDEVVEVILPSPNEEFKSSSEYYYIDKHGKRYFEFFTDVLRRQLALTYSDITQFENHFPFFSKIINLLQENGYKELKTFIDSTIKKNQISFKYSQNVKSILATYKKQINSLTKLFPKSHIKSEIWQKNIFTVVQSVVKKKYNYFDSEYKKYYEPNSKEFFKKFEKDFILEILVEQMISYYERNKLKILFRLCTDLNKRNEVTIKINGKKNMESILDKFSLKISIGRINELIKVLKKAGLFREVISKKNLSGLLDDYEFAPLSRVLVGQPEFFISFISYNYPFSKTELELWEEYLDWRLVSSNVNIQFNFNLISCFSHKWFWVELSLNKSIFWNIELISSFLHSLYRPDHILGNPMFAISLMGNVQWSVELITEFKEKWDWQGLSSNENLPWSKTLIKRFSSLWNWRSLCVNGKFWTEKMIYSLENELDENKERWNHLFSNPHIHWSKKLIYKYKEKWFSSPYTGRRDPVTGNQIHDVYENSSLPWDEEFIELFKEKFNWYRLSASTVLPWSEKLISKYSQSWLWEILGNNKSIAWDEKLMINYEEKLFINETYLGSIFDNPNVKWSEFLIEKYKDKIDWKVLSENININWTTDLIDKYIDKWDWENLSSNITFPWTDDLIIKYASKINYNALTRNESISWNCDLIEKFKEKIEWKSFCEINKNWSEEIINKFNEYFEWDRLADNIFFPWNLDLVRRFRSQLLSNNFFWKERIFLKKAMPKDLNYFDYLVETLSDFKLEYPQKIMNYGAFFSSDEILKIDKTFFPILNKITVYIIVNLLNQDCILPKFLSEKETENVAEENQLELERMKDLESPSEYAHKKELADFLGYDDNDIDDISEDDIWERTGH